MAHPRRAHEDARAAHRAAISASHRDIERVSAVDEPPDGVQAKRAVLHFPQRTHARAAHERERHPRRAPTHGGTRMKR